VGRFNSNAAPSELLSVTSSNTRRCVRKRTAASSHAGFPSAPRDLNPDRESAPSGLPGWNALLPESSGRPPITHRTNLPTWHR